MVRSGRRDGAVQRTGGRATIGSAIIPNAAKTCQV